MANCGRKKDDLSYLIKRNALKRKSEKTSEELKLLGKKISVGGEKEKIIIVNFQWQYEK